MAPRAGRGAARPALSRRLAPAGALAARGLFAADNMLITVHSSCHHRHNNGHNRHTVLLNCTIGMMIGIIDIIGIIGILGIMICILGIKGIMCIICIIMLINEHTRHKTGATGSPLPAPSERGAVGQIAPQRGRRTCPVLRLRRALAYGACVGCLRRVLA